MINNVAMTNTHTLNVTTTDGLQYEILEVNDEGVQAVVSAVNLGEHALSVDQHFADGSRIRQLFVMANITHVAILTEGEDDLE